VVGGYWARNILGVRVVGYSRWGFGLFDRKPFGSNGRNKKKTKNKNNILNFVRSCDYIRIVLRCDNTGWSHQNFLPGIKKAKIRGLIFLQKNGHNNKEYFFNNQNQLESIEVSKESSPVLSYTYTLRPEGNRSRVTESTGKTVNWTYDSLYRLTSETVSNDPAGINGFVGYTYDEVGNRLTKDEYDYGYGGSHIESGLRWAI
jgi:YD repeat-containing protein